MFDWILKKSASYCDVLREEASFEEKRELAKLVKAKGWIEAYRWMNENLPLVKEYLSLPQHQRAAKKWQSYKPMLYLAAYLLCRIGHEFVERADRLELASGTKDAIALAGEEGFQMIFFSDTEGFVLDFFDGSPDDYL